MPTHVHDPGSVSGLDLRSLQVSTSHSKYCPANGITVKGKVCYSVLCFGNFRRCMFTAGYTIEFGP